MRKTSEEIKTDISAIRRASEMVNVLIPYPLRRFTDGSEEVTAEGTTVREIMEYLDRKYPGLEGVMRTAEGELKAFVNVYLNKEDIKSLENLETQVGDGDELSIVPALGGG